MTTENNVSNGDYGKAVLLSGESETIYSQRKSSEELGVTLSDPKTPSSLSKQGARGAKAEDTSLKAANRICYEELGRN